MRHRSAFHQKDRSRAQEGHYPERRSMVHSLCRNGSERHRPDRCKVHGGGWALYRYLRYVPKIT